MSPSRTRMSPSLSGVAAAVAVRNSLELKHLKYFPGTGRSRLRDKRPYRVQQFRTNSRYTIEAGEGAKETVLGAPGDDALRQRRSDARQTSDFRHVGAVQIDSLTGRERIGPGRAGRRLELHVAGRRLGRGGEEEADAGAGQGKRGQEKSGTFVV